MNKLTTVLCTNGTGLWSRVAKNVNVIGFDMPYVTDEQNFGELRVYFDTASWNVDTDGLIYTDRLFLLQLQMFLDEHFGSADLSYSEQGMQGDNFVSLDVGEDFIKSYMTNVLA
jgi:hypothetical protein